MTPDILCLTGCDESFAPLADISVRSLRHYCQRHGFSLTFQPLAEGDRSASWGKIPLIQGAFQKGAEFVWWVDADALVVDPSRSIREVIEPGKDCYFVQHDDGRRSNPNAGIMLLRNSPWMMDFLQRVWDLEVYVDHKWWENAAIIHLLSRDSFADEGITDDRDRVDDTYVKWLDPAWNSIPYVQHGRFASPHPIINHYASLPFKYRLASMHRDFQRSPAGREASASTPTWFQQWRRLRRMRRFEEQG